MMHEQPPVAASRFLEWALGEHAEDVRRSVVGRTALLATIGVAIGTGVSLVGTRPLGSLLFRVEPTDPVTFAGMITVLVLVALLSGLIPAIRASRTDPADALRSAA